MPRLLLSLQMEVEQIMKVGACGLGLGYVRRGGPPPVFPIRCYPWAAITTSCNFRYIHLRRDAIMCVLTNSRFVVSPSSHPQGGYDHYMQKETHMFYR